MEVRGQKCKQFKIVYSHYIFATNLTSIKSCCLVQTSGTMLISSVLIELTPNNFKVPWILFHFGGKPFMKSQLNTYIIYAFNFTRYFLLIKKIAFGKKSGEIIAAYLLSWNYKNSEKATQIWGNLPQVDLKFT